MKRSLMVLLAGVSAGVFADTLTWTAPGGGKWSNAANWSSTGSHAVPQSGDTILITNLQDQQTYENDIPGLSCPHLEFGGAASSSKTLITGQAVTLTGGWDAAAAKSGRFTCRLPLVLTVQNGNPTNRFNGAGGRWEQYGHVSGPGLLCKDGGSIMEIGGGNSYTGGTVNLGAGGWLDPYRVASGDNAGDTPMGTGGYELRTTGLSRFSAPFPTDIRIEPPADKGATTTDLLLYSGASRFSGSITGTRLVAAVDAYASTVFAGDVSIPGGPVRLTFQSPGTASTIAPSIAGRLTCGSFNDQVRSPTADIKASVTLAHADNEIGALHTRYWNLVAGAKGAFGRGAVVYLGAAQEGRGTLDLNGFDQTIDRFEADESDPEAAEAGRAVTSATPARLTLAATRSCTTDARFDGALTLVWNPAAYQGFSTHADVARAHGMTGAIVVSNGVFTVAGGHTFPSATAVEVADGASFLWQSSGASGLAAVARVKVGAGATFAVAAGAELPFARRDKYARAALDLDATARFELPVGTEIPVVGLATNGVALPVPAVFSGDPADADAIYLPQLAGSGARLRTVAALPPSVVTRVSSRAYVQDGLVLQLDGFDNAGRGVHDDAATVWSDLTGLYDPNGNCDFAVTPGVGSFSSDGLKKTASGVLAVNLTRRDDVRTLEARVSDVAKAGSGWVMPVFVSSYQNITFRDAGGVRRCTLDFAAFGLDFTPCADPVTLCALYDQRTSASALYQDGVQPEGVTALDSWSDNNNPGGSTTLGGRAITWAGSDTSPSGYTLNAVRLYTRKLTEDEVRLNAAVDALRFRNEIPADCPDYRESPERAGAVQCRVQVQVSGADVTFGNAFETCTGGAWADLGDRVQVTVKPDAAHRFTSWSGDVDAIVEGDETSPTVTVLVDRALTLRVRMDVAPFTVVCDTNLTADVACRGVVFMGPYTVTAAPGVSLAVESDGAGVTFADGVTGTAAIACPLALGADFGGAVQALAVPAGATLEIRNGLAGRAPLSLPGPGDVRIAGGAGAYAGSIDAAAGTLTVSGAFLDGSAELVLRGDARLVLAGADVGGLVRNTIDANVTWLTVANGTENELRNGFVCDSQLGTIQTGDASSVLRIARNLANGKGVYVYPIGAGTLHVSDISYPNTMMGGFEPRAGTKIHLHCAGALKVGNHISTHGDLYSHAANTLEHSPLRLYSDATWDLGGFDQTCGRFSWMDDYPGATIRSDAPATLRVYQDVQSGSGSNRGTVTYRGRIDGAVSFVKTGNETSTDAAACVAEDLVLGSAVASTGDVSCVWGLLSFTNGADRVGSWTGCAKATAGRTVDARGEAHAGVLELQHSGVFGKDTDVYVAKGAKIRLLAGVSQRVRDLYFEDDAGEWVKQKAGAWGATASGAAHRSDAAFEGAGILRALGSVQSTVLVFR